MKRDGECPKCHGRRVARLSHVADQTDGTGPGRYLALRNDYFAALYAGVIEAYVCADCGYFEEYVRDVATVPWDKLKGFSWHRPKGDDGGPFR